MITESLEKMFIIRTDPETGVTSVGRCIAGSYNTGIEIVGFGHPKNGNRGATVSVCFDIKSVEFPRSAVLRNCKLIRHHAGGSAPSDSEYYLFELDTPDPALRDAVKLMLESQFLLPEQRKRLAGLEEGGKVDLKIICTDTNEYANKIICNCMFNDDTIPVFKLNPNAPLDVLKLTSYEEDAFYTVENGKVVKAKKSNNNRELSFLTNWELLQFIAFMQQATSPTK